MSKRFLLAISMLALGTIIAGYLRYGRPSAHPPETVVARGPVLNPARIEPEQKSAVPQLQQQLKALRAALENEIGERRRLQDRLDELGDQLAALHSTATEDPANAAPDSPVAQNAPAANAPSQEEAQPGTAAPATNEAPNFTERALIAAGVEPTEAARLKRQEDEFTMARMYLRDRADREGWASTPRFAEEMSELERNRTSIRDEIGDDTYDRYLAASGQPNRVTVNEVLVESPAAEAGLQPGDVVLRYGETRIFAPNELVSETRGGEAGETVRVEVLRQGQRLEVDVPRGPLGIRIAASQAQPGDG